MSYNKKNPRFSNILAERKTKSKTTPISAEFVVDSGSESDSTSSDTDESSIKQSLKRKVSEISGSGQAKKGKVSSGTEDQRTSRRRNGKVNGELTEKSRRKKNWLAELSDSESKEGSSSDSGGDDHAEKVLSSQHRSGAQERQLDSKSSIDSEDDDRDGMTDQNDDEDSTSSSESVASSISASTPAEAEAVVIPLNTNGTSTPGSFQPPEGYTSPSITTVATSNIRNLFSVENLKGKEIWHFTVPDSISISDIQNFTQTDITKRKAVLRHRDADYGLNTESRTGAMSKVFVPARAGSKYEPIALPIHHTLHLRQITKIPSTSSRPDAETAGIIHGARKSTLKQPKGLKLGLFPIGDVDIDNDLQDTVKQAKQRVENSRIEPPPEPISKPRKSKKQKISSSDPKETTEWVDPESYNAPVVVGSASQHTTEFPSEPDPSMDPEVLNETQESQAIGEDAKIKAQRKAEKAARREARRARKAARDTQD